MGVKRPLAGSGPLEGLIKGSNIYFAVTSGNAKISFVAESRGGTINGSYKVDQEGSPEQQGTFTAHKTSSEGPASDFDPSQCPTDADMNK